MHMRKLMIAILLVVLLGVGIGSYMLLRHKTNHALVGVSKSNTASRVYHQIDLPFPNSAPTPQVTITFDQYGFEPNQFRVPVGTKINVTNATDSPLLFEPLSGQANQLLSMALGYIASDQNKSFTITKTGNWQFEGDNSPAIRGDLVATPVGASTATLSATELPQYDPKAHSLLINYTNYGFVPNIAIVPVGTKITILNSTNQGGMSFDEVSNDPLPDPALNLGVLETGQEASVTLNRPGTWHYLNAWETTDKGQITAQ